MPDRARRAAEPQFAVGYDFGTSSVRTLIVDASNGDEVACSVFEYPTGTGGVVLDPRDSLVARQYPGDYITGIVKGTALALQLASGYPGFVPQNIVGIGVDTTGSTPLPVDQRGTPLALLPEFEGEPAALAWLWKDHSSHAEAEEITSTIRAMGLPYLSACGGVYSSEWYWSKILRCERTAPRVAAAAWTWMECCDWVPAWLTAQTDASHCARGVCAAGHKAMYNDSWGGLPSSQLLDRLSAGLSRFRYRFATPARTSDQIAGRLAPSVAERLGLPAGIPVAVGAIDAHMGAVGAGIGPGTLVKIIGTSTCDCMVCPADKPLADIPGVCGIVKGSVLPGMYGIEAGQSAVGDIFDWFAGVTGKSHESLTAEASRSPPGASGLVSLDWHNGNRTVLVDPLLTGLTLGQTLSTKPGEIYRSLIEATAFGALAIIERIEEYGVRIERVVACGGIAEKSPLLMQIYADVFNRPMHISRSSQTCALGAAIFGAVVGGTHSDVATAQGAMTALKPLVYSPIAAHVRVYAELYGLYRLLHDGFATDAGAVNLSGFMKQLLAIRGQSRGV